MGKEHTRLSFREWVADILDIPADATADVPRVILTGYHELILTGHKGVLEYTDERIIVRVGKRTVSVEGNGLTVRTMTRSAAMLDGNIYRINLED